jgi:hypothetical protein
MNSFRLVLRSMIVAASLASIPALGAPVNTPPARIGNVWNGTAHEPDPLVVASQERRSSIALPPQREKAETDEVESLYERLVRDEGLQRTTK